MNARACVLVAAAGSAAMLTAALMSQFVFGHYPCELCLWQRWPHLAAMGIGAAALVLPGAVWPWLGALAALTTAGIGGYHGGVEQGWWAGLESCSAAIDLGAFSVEALLDPTAHVPAPVRCDAITVEVMGLSMAVWNMILSLGLAGIWIAAARRMA